MKLTITLEYFTRWGESVFIEFAGRPPVVMNPLPGNIWSISLDDPSLLPGCEYSFSLRDTGEKLLRSEWRRHVLPDFVADLTSLTIRDLWIDRPAERAYLTAPFLDCFCRRTNRARKAPRLIHSSVGFSVTAPLVPPGMAVAVCGSIPELGSWNPAKAVILSDASYPVWKAVIPVDPSVDGFDYKLMLVDRRSGEFVSWEPRENRTVYLGHREPGSAVSLEGLTMALPEMPWHGAGVSIPVFSLRSENDWGVGDFIDLIPFVDWTVATGQCFIQLLPVNDTTMTGTWTDSYPYNANSTFALHPMYIRPEEAGLLPGDRMGYYEARKAGLRKLKDVDYEQVNRLKNEYMRELFALIGSELIVLPDFQNFIAANSSWLVPYAAYCVLRDKYGTPNHSLWGVYKNYEPRAINAFVAENHSEINFVYFQQYVLDRQLCKARDYAHSRGVALKGDIPIGISRTSVDAWKEPNLFNLNASAGAPPDAFSTLGQNWGFPTYNWDAMSRDGFAWWKARFRKMSEYFDAYRIDHVLGFFRIWQISSSALHGLLGVFNSALPYSHEELVRDYDFRPDPAALAVPFIADWMLPDFFGGLTDHVICEYLTPIDDHHFALRPEFSDQCKIADYFGKQPLTDENSLICRGLIDLCDQVLFIEDPYRKGLYHPRISGMNTYAYRNLCDYDKWLFSRIHDDFFYRRNDAYWREQGLWKLPPVIEATDMLTCAEDLGMIPACVPDVLRQLQILTLEIQRMPKDLGEEFGNTYQYPYMSVCTTSTHDMPGIRQWWESDRRLAQDYFNRVLHCEGEAPAVADTWICKRIIELHLASPSMLCILPLQDWLSISADLRRRDPSEEQINFPANSRHYWRYRMHLTIEHLLAADHLNNEIRTLVRNSSRQQ
ncbi:MAG: 4-alpha-glucanotransferase [Bacteroides sp.]|nr:4-alpha-glucanotransferase [Bacteroides sp.]